MKILLEGPDGAGKTTLAAALVSRLGQSTSRAVLPVADPNHLIGTMPPVGTPRSLRDLLLAPHLRLSPHAVTRADVMRREEYADLKGPLPPQVACGLIVAGEAATALRVAELERWERRPAGPPIFVFDRWSPSTIVYQAFASTAEDWLSSPGERGRAIADSYRRFVGFEISISFLLLAADSRRVMDLFERSKHRPRNAYEMSTDQEARNTFLSRHEHYAQLDHFIAGIDSYRSLVAPGGFVPLDALQPTETLVDEVLGHLRRKGLL